MAAFPRKLVRAVMPDRVLSSYHAARGVADRVDDLERRAARLNLTVAAHLYPPADTGMAQHELNVYSQNGEDGILLWLFSVLGTETRTFVEFGVGNGHECNSRLLAQEWGWRGLQIEGGEDLAAEAEHIAGPGVTVARGYVTAENINDRIRQAGLSGDIDLLSVDIDGNDYWLWKAIEVVSPRLVIIEYNAAYGPTKEVVARYEPQRVPSFGYTLETQLQWGSSLPALVRLGDDKGYRLIGCDSSGVNAFFARDDALREPLSPVSAATGWRPSERWRGRLSQAEQEAVALGGTSGAAGR